VKGRRKEERKGKERVIHEEENMTGVLLRGVVGN
jgi:hypothetical protein